MLLRYVVSNYKSIGHPIVFSMLPTEESTDSRYLKEIKTRHGTWKVLQRGGIFGPNASGKSTFIESIEFARSFIVNGQKRGNGINIEQFKGEDKDLQGKSLFQFMIYVDSEVFEYGFVVDSHQVYEEWLFQLSKQAVETCFSRDTDKNGKTRIEVTNKLASKDSKGREVADILARSFQEDQKNQLFLYKLFDNGNRKATLVINWFLNLKMIFPETKVKALPIQIRSNENLRKYIEDMLYAMGTGVNHVSVASSEVDFQELVDQNILPPALLADLRDKQSGIVNINGKYFIFWENEKKRTTLTKLFFTHVLNGRSVQFDIDEESDGTQRLLDLLPLLFSMNNNGTTLYFVDEIDRSLHTKLSQHLLQEFIRRCEHTNNQIFFTAHDVNLINLDLLRQEEIWFIEKDQRGESFLRPLSDFKVQEGQDILKAYLNGRFGAIPVIRGRS